MENMKKRLRDRQDTVRKSSICLSRLLERQERANGKKTLLKGITEN